MQSVKTAGGLRTALAGSWIELLVLSFTLRYFWSLVVVASDYFGVKNHEIKNPFLSTIQTPDNQ